MRASDRGRRLCVALASEPVTTAGRRLILAVIVVNTGAVVLGTVDTLAGRYGPLFRAIEYAAVAVFTVELVARVASRLVRSRRLVDPYLVIDAIAVLPFYLGLALGIGVLSSSSLVRVLRLFKLARYYDAAVLFGRVLRRKGEDLAVSMFGTLLLLLVAASSVYFAEHEAQPEAFSSIPATLWWAGVTITTVGYGDVYPVTPLGRVLAVVVALLGVGVAAVPTSILVSGFREEATPEQATCPHCGERLDG